MIWICSLIAAPLVAWLLFSVARYASSRLPLRDGRLKRILFFSWKV